MDANKENAAAGLVLRTRRAGTEAKGGLAGHKGIQKRVITDITNMTQKPIKENKPQKTAFENISKVEEKESSQSEATPAPAAPVARDPQEVEEYRAEAAAYLLGLEQRPGLLVAAGFLAGQEEVRPAVRALLVDWMVGAGLELNLLPETLQLAVSCLDRFLQAKLAGLARDQLQLVAATALLVAAKYEETFPPAVADLSYLAAGAAPGPALLAMERRMLATLGWSLGVPRHQQFLRWARLADPGLVRPDTHCLAQYLAELSLVDHGLAHLAASVRAAAAVALAARLLAAGSVRAAWGRKLQAATGLGLQQLEPTVRQMARLLGVAATNRTLLTVYRKYSNGAFRAVARLPALGGPLVAQLAGGEGL